MENPQTKLNILKDSPFKLIIPKNVEQKIRYHINRFPTTEWSGFMFYDYVGSFEENNLVFTARDFVVLDIGSATQTSFDDSAKVVNYQIEHDLLDCKEALIHSHHRMGAFFSGTDDNAIRQEALNVNHFLSLVVDTRGTYVARVTKRNVIKQTVNQTITEEICYPTYDGKVVCSQGTTKSTQNFKQELSEVVVYPLHIEVEHADSMSEWERDLEEIYALKKATANVGTLAQRAQVPPFKSYQDEVPSTQGTQGAQGTQLTLFDGKDDSTVDYYYDRIPPFTRRVDMESPKESASIDNAALKSVVSSQLINLTTLQIVSLNALIDEQMISQTPQFCVMLPNRVTKVFKDSARYELFLTAFIDSLMTDIQEECPSLEILDEFTACLAEGIQARLRTLPQNKCIHEIINALNGYKL